MLKTNNQHITTQLRKSIRIAAKGGKKGGLNDYVYCAARIAKEVAQYHPVWGCDLVWDFDKFCWLDGRGMDLFHAACQIAGNAFTYRGRKCSPELIARLVEIIIDMGVDEEEEHFNMPPTKAVIAKFKTL